MARTPYALITVLGTGAPWCEQETDTTFEHFMHATFGSTIVQGLPSQAQDMEFSCAHPTRNGSNSMLKGSSACFLSGARETPRIILTVRGLWMPAGEADIIRSPELGRSATKFWLAISVSREITIPPQLANDRYSLYRRRPSEIVDCVSEGDLSRIQNAVLQSVKRAQEILTDRRTQTGKRRKPEGSGELKELNCLQKLVAQLGVAEVIPDELRSTAWKPCGHTVFGPGDILRRGCSCARLAPFPEHMYVDCRV